MNGDDPNPHYYYNISSVSGTTIQTYDVANTDDDRMEEIIVLTDEGVVVVEYNSKNSIVKEITAPTMGIPKEICGGNMSDSGDKEIAFFYDSKMAVHREYSAFSMALTNPSNFCSRDADVNNTYQGYTVKWDLIFTDEANVSLRINGTEKLEESHTEGSSEFSYDFAPSLEGMYNVSLKASICGTAIKSYFWINYVIGLLEPKIFLENNTYSNKLSRTFDFSGSDDIYSIDTWNLAITYLSNGSVAYQAYETSTTHSMTFNDTSETYNITVWCNDTKGDTNATWKKLYLDRDPPNVDFTTTNNQNITDTTFSINGEKSDDFGLNHSAIYVNSSFRRNTTNDSYDLHLHKNGTATITIRQYDDVGNTNTTQINVTVDQEMPVVYITSPSDGRYLNTSSVTVEWGAADTYTGIEYYEVRLDGGDWIKAEDTSHTFHNLGEIDHDVDVKAVNWVSHSNTTSVHFTNDYTDPDLGITSPDDGNVTGSPFMEVEWSGSDKYGLEGYSYKLDDAGWNNVSKHTETHTFPSLTEGGHTVYIRSFDRAGNTEIEDVTFTVDLSAPLLEIKAPQDGNTLGNQTVEFQYNGTDEISAIAYYRSRVGGGNWSAKIYQEQFSHTFSSVGTFFVEILAVDRANNNATVSLDVSVDFKKPKLDITVHPANKSVQEKVNFTLEWGASDDEYWVDHFEVFVDTQTPVTLPNTTTAYHFTNLSQGKHTLNVRAVDRLHNARTIPTLILVDFEPPTMTFITPENKTFTTDSPTIRYTVSDAGVGVGVISYSLEGERYKNTTASSINFTKLANGHYIVDFIVYDKVATGETSYSASALGNAHPRGAAVNHTASFTYEFTVNVEEGEEYGGILGGIFKAIGLVGWVCIGLTAIACILAAISYKKMKERGDH